MSFALPMLWLVAIPGGVSKAGEASNFSRALLLMISVIQYLYGFPVAGEQMQFMEICPIAVAAVCLSDGLRELEFRLPQALVAGKRRAAVTVAGALLVALCVAIAWNAVHVYDARPGLQLRGAHLIHLSPEDTRVREEIVRLAGADGCGTLITVPGMPSFNVWTGLKSPPSLRGGPWILFDESGQDHLARQLSGDAHSCVIVNRMMADLWSTSYAAYPSPMARFIRDNYRTEFDSGDYRFLIRR